MRPVVGGREVRAKTGDGASGGNEGFPGWEGVGAEVLLLGDAVSIVGEGEGEGGGSKRW